MMHQNDQTNGQTVVTPQPIMGQDEGGPGIINTAKGLFDNLKTPVFWIAVGFIACKFMDRKRNKA